MSRYTLARDFRSIDPRQTRVVLVEAGPRILPTFDAKLAARAMRDLEVARVCRSGPARSSPTVTADGVTVGGKSVSRPRQCYGRQACAQPISAAHLACRSIAQGES